MAVPNLRFAEASDGVRVGYQRIGSGSPVVVVGEELQHIVVRWDAPESRRMFEYMADSLDVVLFDQRGCGSSDAVRESSLEDRCLDIDAILDREGLSRVGLLAHGSGAIVAAAYAVSRPDHVDRVVLWNGRAPVPYRDEAWALAPDAPLTREEHSLLMANIVQDWGTDVTSFLSLTVPDLVHDGAVVEWWMRYQRVVVSRDAMVSQFQDVDTWEPTREALGFSHPALVSHSERNRAVHIGNSRWWADLLPNAVLETTDSSAYIVEYSRRWQETLSRQIEFLTGSRPAVPTRREYAAVLFTDIVNSTAASLRAGDDKWRDMLDSHDRITRRGVESEHGRLVKSTGDGILAVFPDPTRAIECALALRDDLATAGFTIRSGIHAGVIEVRGSDVSGAVVNLAARAMAAANDGDVAVTASVRDQLLGSDYQFRTLGSHTLKGFESERELFAVGL